MLKNEGFLKILLIFKCGIHKSHAWHGGVMVKVVVHQAQGGKDRFPAGPRALLIWFESGRKGLGSCIRFEELNK